jgi:hypothetical protein
MDKETQQSNGPEGQHEQTVYLGVRVPPKIKQFIRERANTERRSMSQVSRLVLEDWYEEQTGQKLKAA